MSSFENDSRLVHLVARLAKRLESAKPCTHCGLFSPSERMLDAVDGWGVWLLGERRHAVFCGPSCVGLFVQSPGMEFVRWTEGEGDCWCCRREALRFIEVAVPYESHWDDTSPAAFCSVKCVAVAMRRDAGELERDDEIQRQLWAFPNWPLEEPRRVASLKRERRKLRRGELARLGF